MTGLGRLPDGRVGATIDGRVFLVGGGSRSVAYRQRCSDLLGMTIVVPRSEETVATGAAAQAAAIAAGETADVVAVRWGLGDGVEISPIVDAGGRRQVYASLTGA